MQSTEIPIPKLWDFYLVVLVLRRIICGFAYVKLAQPAATMDMIAEKRTLADWLADGAE
jgi:hypothetical protein